MKLRYTLRAAEELDQVLSYIDGRSPRGAHQVRERIKTIVDLIALHPHAGRLTNSPGLRRVIAHPYPYLIFYSVTDNEVGPGRPSRGPEPILHPRLTLCTGAKSETPLTPSRSRPSAAGRAG